MFYRLLGAIKDCGLNDEIDSLAHELSSLP